MQQIARQGDQAWIVADSELFPWHSTRVQASRDRVPGRIAQVAVSSIGKLYVASSEGVFRDAAGGWERISVVDPGGRAWGSRDVLGVAFDSLQQLWIATQAGVAHRASSGWIFHEGKDGLPYSDFTGIAAGPDGVVW